MADPVLDEQNIIDLLEYPLSAPDSLAAHQSASVQVLLDLFDRKATRDEFIDGITMMIPIYGQVSKLWLLHNIKDVYESGRLSSAEFVDADKRMCDLLRTQCATAIELVRRLQQCPTSQDKVH